MLHVQPTRLTDREFAHICVTELPEDISVEWVRELTKRFYDSVHMVKTLTDECERLEKERDDLLSDLIASTK